MTPPDAALAAACSECLDWFDNPLNRGRVTAESPRCPIQGGLCVRFPDGVLPPIKVAASDAALAAALETLRECCLDPHTPDPGVVEEALALVAARLQAQEEEIAASAVVDALADNIDEGCRAIAQAVYAWLDVASAEEGRLQALEAIAQAARALTRAVIWSDEPTYAALVAALTTASAGPVAAP